MVNSRINFRLFSSYTSSSSSLLREALSAFARVSETGIARKHFAYVSGILRIAFSHLAIASQLICLFFRHFVLQRASERANESMSESS